MGNVFRLVYNLLPWVRRRLVEQVTQKLRGDPTPASLSYAQLEMAYQQARMGKIEPDQALVSPAFYNYLRRIAGKPPIDFDTLDSTDEDGLEFATSDSDTDPATLAG